MSMAPILVTIVGALLGGLLVAVGRRTRGEVRLYAGALIVAALVYVGFSAIGEPSRLPLEALGLALFGVVAAVGARRWPLLVGIGWAAHVAWDLALHPPGVADGVPWWYPPLCVGFDLVVAARAVRAR